MIRGEMLSVHHCRCLGSARRLGCVILCRSCPGIPTPRPCWILAALGKLARLSSAPKQRRWA